MTWCTCPATWCASAAAPPLCPPASRGAERAFAPRLPRPSRCAGDRVVPRAARARPAAGAQRRAPWRGGAAAHQRGRHARVRGARPRRRDAQAAAGARRRRVARGVKPCVAGRTGRTETPFRSAFSGFARLGTARVPSPLAPPSLRARACARPGARSRAGSGSRLRRGRSNSLPPALGASGLACAPPPPLRHGQPPHARAACGGHGGRRAALPARPRQPPNQCQWPVG